MPAAKGKMMTTDNLIERDDRLAFLADLLLEPAALMPLTVRPAADIDTVAMRKVTRTGFEADSYDLGDAEVFLDNGQGALYPVIGEFPVLMGPERIVSLDSTDTVDLKSPQYHEAYIEMQHYNRIGREGVAEISPEKVRTLMAGLAERPEDTSDFPRPAEMWIDARHDSLSQFEAYDYLSPVQGRRFLQLGGGGTHAVKALVAGAELGVLLTPMLGEAEFAKTLARYFGVENRLFCVIGVGEELPFAAASFDRIYSGGCLHHMRTEMAFAELSRILTPGGRFACVDPWKTVLHRVGTRIFGKREAGIFCRPIDPDRLAPLSSSFQNSTVNRHGPFLRYVFLALEKFGLRLSPRTMMRIMHLDNRSGSLLGLTQSFGGSIVICGER